METLTYERRQTSGKREAELSKLPVETVTYLSKSARAAAAPCMK
ncbi:hypothetical protein PPOP_2962 [Paenibacillus popilliae ATCC 14706]|uniref:Uncharacterized protein n=1 Tax=Paenibacillus popilliae ATCC 14706 TaxID=1212764 RepID=M9M3I5_PAEPP|nr:hypothetical protein PPOP_2962 [Paenibacillus popilliae ATCC 14706]